MKNKLTLVFILSFLLFLGFFGCKKEQETSEKELPEWLKNKYANSKPVVDEYEFPDISGMNDWGTPGIIQRRKAALQIPEVVLASISTAGLLETCLDYPYNIDMFHSYNFQPSFNMLMEQFNGYPELLQRPDLINALLDKYYRLTYDVKNACFLESIEIGRFSYRLFLFEFMLAQDIVIANLSEEQEQELFLLSLYHKELKSRYPDIYRELHNVPRALLYAKIITRDNSADGYTYEVEEFIKAPGPQSIDLNTVKYLDDYTYAKYKYLYGNR